MVTLRDDNPMDGEWIEPLTNVRCKPGDHVWYTVSNGPITNYLCEVCGRRAG